MRDAHWRCTALGDMHDWPASLKMAVTTVLDAPLPMLLLWGQHLIQIYNDAYRHFPGLRHPAALGQACGMDGAHAMEAICRRVLDHGASIHLEDQEYAGTSPDQPRHFSTSYTPARDQTGAVCGVFVLAQDTTRRLLAERENRHLLTEAPLADDRLRQMFEQAPSFMAMLKSPDHVFDMVNAACQRLLPQRRLLGMPVRIAIPEAESQGFVTLLDEAYRSGKPFLASAMPIVLQDDDGGPACAHYLDFVYQPVLDAEGKVDAIFIDGNDVTEQRDAHRELALLYDQLSDKVRRLEKAERRQTFQLALADCLRTTPPLQDVVTAACALLGNFLGVARVVFCEVDDANGTFFVRREWARTGLTSVTGNIRTLDEFGADNIAILRAGQVFACDDTAQDSRTAEHAAAYARIDIIASLAIPLVKAGKLTTILNLHQVQPYHWTDEDIEFARDMAERTWSAAESARAQDELRAERDHSQYIFDNLAEGFGLIDAQWHVIQMNAEGLRLGRRCAAEVIGKIHWDIWPETAGTEVEQVYRRVRASGKPEILEQCVPLSNGQHAWLEVRVHRALGGELAIFYHDITDRKNIEAKLVDAVRHKDEFLAMLAHELRNPLAPISAAAALLSVAHLDEARIRHISAIISRQAGHMTNLIDDLLDVSRVTQGFVRLDKTALDVKSLVADAVEQVRPLLDARRHQFTLHLAPEAVWVSGDRKRLVQVLANLLGNAAKYTPDGGCIALTMEASGDQVMLSVQDNGIGMSPALVRRAFELFSQAERASHRVEGGLGIGLALVKSLVELHGGIVAAQSQGPGTGSTFSLTLPRLQHAPAAADDACPPQAAVQALRILVVDDNVDAATMLAMLLEAAGHHVVVRHGSRPALELVRTAVFDACLLDIGLPEMDGNALARCLRAMPDMAQAVLIAVTGYGQKQDQENAYAAGFHHHFVKPVDSARLTALLTGISHARPGPLAMPTL